MWESAYMVKKTSIQSFEELPLKMLGVECTNF